MSPQAKFWISLFVVAFDIGIVMYFASSFSSDPVIITGLATFMVISSIHVVLTIWFGDKWFSSPDFRAFLSRFVGRAD